MLEKIFKKDKYLNCPFMKHSIHFFYDEIRACCTNISGPVFYPDYKGEKVDWSYVYGERKKLISHINSIFSKEMPPKCCEGCCEINSYYQNLPVDKFNNYIDRMYFHNNMSCNARCTYCTYGYIDRGFRYKVLPLVKELIDKEILSKNAMVYMSGGEITISPEFEDLLSLLLNYLNSQIEILTSGIKYCKSIENAFVQNKCRLLISLDSSSRETYKTIKQVDCFDKVVDNLKNYIAASDNARNNITLKYILVDGVNDNITELSNFVKLVKELDIKNIRLDFDYEKYKYTRDITVPEYYFDLYKEFNNLSSEAGLIIQDCEQVKAILNKSR
ncbi:MAG: radical SAM protein [Candidatus Gastranaerophilales bacterium]|nr:radical SAM protein [Candidatus Gastranaerophilales bacterium]